MKSMDSLVSSAEHRNWLGNGITDSASIVQKDGILVIRDTTKKTQWQEFESQLEGISKSLIVITDGVPQEWITNNKLVVLRRQNPLRVGLEKVADHIKKNKFDHFHRQSDKLEYDYFLMYGRYEYERETVMKELESRAILTNSLYSRPSVDSQSGRSIESIGTDASLEFRFNHDSNYDTVVKNSQRCHCSVVLENDGLFAESDRSITEKSLWPVLAQVPFVWAVAPNKIQQLKEYGFRPNDPPRTDLRSLTEQLLWLKSEFADPHRTQKWQDEQGETINHNLTILKGLADRIDEDIYQQLSQL